MAYMTRSEDIYGSLFSPSGMWILGVLLTLAVSLTASTFKLLDLLKAGKQVFQSNEHLPFLTLKYF